MGCEQWFQRYGKCYQRSWSMSQILFVTNSLSTIELPRTQEDRRFVISVWMNSKLNTHHQVYWAPLALEHARIPCAGEQARCR